MAAKELYGAQKTWEQSGANDSKDKELSDANHNRAYDPSGESARVSEKLNQDAAKYKQPARSM